MSDSHDHDQSHSGGGGMGKIAKFIFIAIGVIIFFSMIVPGCIKGCTGSSSKPKKERSAGSRGSSIQIQQEATFKILSLDKNGKVLSTIHGSTPWIGEVSPYFQIIPDSGMVISVTQPGYYTENKYWHYATETILRGGQSNPPLPPRGHGAIKIKAVAE